MALTTISDIEQLLEERDVISISEPTCGFGGMVLSIAETLKERGVDIARRVHFHMVDVDLLCVRAAYIQTDFADISAVVVHGDVLRLTEHASFFKPASID